MELTLLGTVGVLAFLVFGAALMLVVSFRRTIELRGALITAIRRIEKLEKAIAAGAQLAAPPPETIDALIARGAPRKEIAPPANLAEVSFVEAAQAALEQEKIEPPNLAVLSFCGALAAFAALAAAQVEAVSDAAGLLLALFTGLVVLLAAEWRRNADRAAKAPAPTGLWPDNAASAALLGFAIILAAILYGWGVLHVLSPIGAFLAASAAALIAAGSSLRHGPPLILCALIIGALAPALAPIGPDAPLARYGFLAALFAFVMLLSRQRDAPIWTWLSALIALVWGAVAAALGGDAAQIAGAGAYYVVFAVLGAVYAWREAEAPVAFPRFWSEPGRWSEPMVVGGGVIIGAAACLLTLVLAHPPPAAPAGASVVAFAAIAIGAHVMRPGLWFASFIAALMASAALVCWPSGPTGIVDAPSLTIVAACLGFVFSLGGWLAMARAHDPRPGATLAAMAPILVFAAAFARFGDFGLPESWAGAAAAIAGINALSYLQLARGKPDAAAPFAAGAVLAVAAAFTALTLELYAPLAIAAALPLAAAAHRWRPEAGFRVAAFLLCAVLLIRLIAPQIYIATAAAPPMLALLFLSSAAACFIASVLFPRITLAAQVCFALGLVLIALCASLVARHEFTGGLIGAPYSSLFEMGVNTLVWLTLALTLGWRFGPRPRAPLFTLEFLAFAAAATHVLVAGLAILNPWWGYAPAPAPGWRGFNAIEFAFAAPALLFFVYSLLRDRQGLPARAAAASAIGLVLLFAALALELRRLFHGSAMAVAPVAPAEGWAYSLATLGFAGLLLALSVERDSKPLRMLSLLLGLIALAKMALADLGSLEGGARLAAFVVILAAGGAMVWFYRRIVLPPTLPRTAAQPNTLGDPNLLPPG